MRVYLDDNSVHHRLVALLRKAGHTVVIPADAGLAGVADPLHLLYAVQQDLVLVTRNFGDFTHLHRLVLGTGGQHAGILLLRSDNDRSKDMSPPETVRAIAKLERAGVPVANQLIVLNQWR